MKKFIFISMFFSQVTLAAQLDKVVAIVNDNIIMLSELKSAEKKYRSNIKSLPYGKNYRLKVLNQLILNILKREFLIKNKASISGDILDSAIQQIAQQNNMSVEQLYQQLPKEGITVMQFRKKIENDIEQIRLQQLLIPKSAVLNKTLVKQHVAKLPKSVVLSDSPKYYNIGHILIEKNQYLANKVTKIVKSNPDFASIAKKYSVTLTAATGGNLGWRLPEQFPDLIAKIIDGGTAGRVYGPIKIDGVWHIVKILATNGGLIRKEFSPEELNSIASKKVMQDKVNRYLNILLNKIKQSAYIDIKIK